MDKRKRKTRNAAQNLALRINITEKKLAAKAGQLFFPQTAICNRRDYKRKKTLSAKPPQEPGIDEPFNIGELLEAIHTAKQESALGPDGITYTALRNLSTEAKEKLLDKYNDVWAKGKLPDSWKVS
ncbi:hypothetical protein HPB47_015418 [Ixodes persulcatus]|uniref:Uncharacterized protein n=1 Tax=Ixodes persulcatus TaxID=34615 RepID=A0AC60QUF2_IXOPE|nr:hypothetical protein HPB47_015418 [Ixodes persulcatus]